MLSQAYAAQKPHTLLLRARAPRASTAGRWVWIATEGSWKGYDDGEFRLDRAAFENAIRIFEENAIELALNFDHDRREAAGWYSALEIRDGAEGAELWGQLRMTEAGSAALQSEAYKYTSIEFDTDSVDEVSGQAVGPRLVGVALTNYPFIKGQKPLAASERAKGIAMNQTQPQQPATAPAPAAAPSAAPTPAPAQPEQPDVTAQEVDEAKVAAGLEALAVLRAVLGLGEDVDDASVLARAQEIMDALQAAAQGSAAPAEQGAPSDQPVAAEPASGAQMSESVRRTVKLQEQTIKQLSEQVQSLTAERDARNHAAVQAEVDEHVRAGRLLDAQRDDMVWLAENSRERFDRLVASLPESKPGARQLAEPKRKAGIASEQSADQLLASLTTEQREFAEQVLARSLTGKANREQAVRKIVDIATRRAKA